MSILSCICSFPDSDRFKAMFDWVLSRNPDFFFTNDYNCNSMHVAAVTGNEYAMDKLRAYVQDNFPASASQINLVQLLLFHRV